MRQEPKTLKPRKSLRGSYLFAFQRFYLTVGAEEGTRLFTTRRFSRNNGKNGVSRKQAKNAGLKVAANFSH